jgi:hypothetical protein
MDVVAGEDTTRTRFPVRIPPTVNTGGPTIAAGVAGAANTDPSTMAS